MCDFLCREILPVSVFWYQLPPISCVHERPRCHRIGRQCALESTMYAGLQSWTLRGWTRSKTRHPLTFGLGSRRSRRGSTCICRPLCGKSFGAQCGQHLRPRTEAVRWSSTRVCMIDELTATLTATRSTISPSTKIITHNLPPNETTVDHRGPFGWTYGLEVSASASAYSRSSGRILGESECVT